jgi:hypothetical protein
VEISSAEFRRVAALIRSLYAIVDELESLFPRNFTPDGHLVGSIGEAVAAFVYDLELLCSSAECHDAKTRDGRLVQVKLTGGTKGVSMYDEAHHLIVLQLVNRNEFIEVYNGPGALPWQQAGKQQKNGQRPISLSRLRELQRDVPAVSILPQVRELKSLMGRQADAAKVGVPQQLIPDNAREQ